MVVAILYRELCSWFRNTVVTNIWTRTFRAVLWQVYGDVWESWTEDNLEYL